MTALLVVVAGLPGTGKTTLSRALARELGAAHLRVDAVETAVEEVTGAPAGVLGYAVVRRLARENLLLGRPVVVDAVCPVPESRSTWGDLAGDTGATVQVLETRLPDADEHRRRVERRAPDMAGQRVPTWADVQALDHAEWDESRDGRRTLVDTTDSAAALATALAALA